MNTHTDAKLSLNLADCNFLFCIKLYFNFDYVYVRLETRCSIAHMYKYHLNYIIYEIEAFKIFEMKVVGGDNCKPGGLIISVVLNISSEKSSVRIIFSLTLIIFHICLHEEKNNT